MSRSLALAPFKIKAPNPPRRSIDRSMSLRPGVAQGSANFAAIRGARSQSPRPILYLASIYRAGGRGNLAPLKVTKKSNPASRARESLSTPARLREWRGEIFFTATVGAEGGSNFLAAQINPGNCGHDNYRPMARSSVTTTPSSNLRPTAQRARINHEKQFPRGQPARRRALDADDAREIEREREREREREGGRERARAFISNKSDRTAFW